MAIYRSSCLVCVGLALTFQLGTQTVLNAQEADGLVLIEPLREYFSEAAKISGHVVASVHAIGINQDTRPYLVAYIPEEWAGKDTCLNLVSDSGLYEGEGVYRVSSHWAGGYAVLSLQSSQHLDYLSKETDRTQIATRLSVGTCGNGEQEFSVTYWNQLPPENNLGVELFINSYRADEAFILANGKELSCSHFETGERISYDFKCLIPATADEKIANKYNIEINRYRDGEYDPPELVSIYVPTPKK